MNYYTAKFVRAGLLNPTEWVIQPVSTTKVILVHTSGETITHEAQAAKHTH